MPAVRCNAGMKGALISAGHSSIGAEFTLKRELLHCWKVMLFASDFAVILGGHLEQFQMSICGRRNTVAIFAPSGDDFVAYVLSMFASALDVAHIAEYDNRRAGLKYYCVRGINPQLVVCA
jgi:hypothetical protein